MTLGDRAAYVFWYGLKYFLLAVSLDLFGDGRHVHWLTDVIAALVLGLLAHTWQTSKAGGRFERWLKTRLGR